MQLFFDSLIVIAITITALPALILLYSRKKRTISWEYRHKKISLFLAIFLLFLTALTGYGSFIEPRLIIINKHEIELEKITQPIKIVFLADIQAGKYKQTAWLEKVVNKIIKLNPDLILLGGDHVDNEYFNPQELVYLEPLIKLKNIAPTYAIHGNHEYGVSCYHGIENRCTYTGDVSQETKKKLEDLGIIYLKNNLEELNIKNNNFYLFGGDCYWQKKLDYTDLNNREKNLPTIALIHNPLSIFEASEHNVDLVLSGHTHGGQIRLPFIGPIGRVDNETPIDWYQGLHENNKTKFLITSGLGESGVRARLFNPPEIVLLTIK